MSTDSDSPSSSSPPSSSPSSPSSPPRGPASGWEDWAVRYRAWIVMGVLVLALVIVGVTGIGGAGNGGGASSAVRPRVAFGSAVEGPPALSTLNYTNGWVVSAGTSLVAVYAGSDRFERQTGLLVVARSTQGHQTRRSLELHDAGAVTLLRPPIVDTMLAAEQATLHFVTANGATGSLNLANDRISLDG